MSDGRPVLRDLEPPTATILAEVLAGLRCPQKELPSKCFYDEHGSQLFDQICELPEYYLTRTELVIMREHAPAMAELFGPRSLLVEYGSGSSLKTRLLLDQLSSPAGYVPIDISREHLLRSAGEMSRDYPGLAVHPVCTDFFSQFELPAVAAPVGRVVVYFPGSTIGNFTPEEAVVLLRGIAAVCGRDGGLLIGVDLAKRRDILEPAYNDAQGVTAAFNLNLLARLNRDLGADFDLNRFGHVAFYNEGEGRIEMHLKCFGKQTVRVGDETFFFSAGETIRTEYSYKYTQERFRDVAARAGFGVRKVWTDEASMFSVQYLSPS